MLDNSLTRREFDGFSFPLGVYPVEAMHPISGYAIEFESADGANEYASGEEGESWEEWPDRFMFDVLISATRLRSLCRSLFSLLPGRIYPILDVIGHDAYREIDPYIAYDLVGIESYFDAVLAFEDWFFEDGLVGFGAMSIEPFMYFFIDEHKIVTIRVELSLKEQIEKLLAAYDLQTVPEIAGADSVEHEHRTVLLAESNGRQLPLADDMIEVLRDRWRLQLNVDGTTNLDDNGVELGITGWRCLVRIVSGESPPRYAEVLLRAACLDKAEELAGSAVLQGAGSISWDQIDIAAMERQTPERYRELADAQPPPSMSEEGIDGLEWLTTEEESES